MGFWVKVQIEYEDSIFQSDVDHGFPPFMCEVYEIFKVILKRDASWRTVTELRFKTSLMGNNLEESMLPSQYLYIHRLGDSTLVYLYNKL